MSLPPIFSNVPFLKNLTGVKTPAVQMPSSTPSASARDVVEISEAARRRLAEARQAPVDDPDAAQKAAQAVRATLAGALDTSLGLDPDFP